MMQTPPTFLIATLADGAERWAAIDPYAHHLEARIGERRFAAYLAPFATEEAAREALIAAGAEHITIEARKRARRG